MLKVKGVELNFDITSPTDMVRYKEAGENMERLAGEIRLPSLSPDDPGFMDAYIEMLNTELRLFGNFIDDVFGDGIAKQLLGSNPSLMLVAEINEELGQALEAQGNDFGIRIQKYKPNRATRQQSEHKPNIATMQQLGWKA